MALSKMKSMENIIWKYGMNTCLYLNIPSFTAWISNGKKKKLTMKKKNNISLYRVLCTWMRNNLKKVTHKCVRSYHIQHTCAAFVHDLECNNAIAYIYKMFCVHWILCNVYIVHVLSVLRSVKPTLPRTHPKSVTKREL